MSIFRWILALTICLGLAAASCDRNEQKRIPTNYSEQDLIDAHKRKLGEETQLIDAFVKYKGWEMARTNTGIRYNIYARGNGDSARTDMIAELDYQVFLLDSTLVETAKGETRKQFRIGHDDVISGLHEAITLLRVGDSARVIIPSYLAYGLSGNQKNIPPNAALYYELTLVDLH